MISKDTLVDWDHRVAENDSAEFNEWFKLYLNTHYALVKWSMKRFEVSDELLDIAEIAFQTLYISQNEILDEPLTKEGVEFLDQQLATDESETQQKYNTWLEQFMIDQSPAYHYFHYKLTRWKKENLFSIALFLIFLLEREKEEIAANDQ